MITIITKWEKGWMPPKVEAEYWLQTVNAFGVDHFLAVPDWYGGAAVTEYSSMEAALAASQGTRVFLEPRINQSLTPVLMKNLESYDHPTDAVYILGNTEAGNVALAQEGDDVVCIDTPAAYTPYGMVICGIVLYDRMVKSDG